MEHTPTPTPARPHVPQSYGIAQTLDRDPAAWPAVERKLAEARNYWIATARRGGRPHAMPVWGIWLDGALYFGTDRQSRKGRNIAANAEIVAHLESGDDVVILEGVVEEAADATLLARYVDAYDAKYQFRPATSDAATVTYTLRPRAAFTWREADFPNSATRWTFG
jgi:hypothetical protein